LNAVIALILRFLRNSTDFQADYMTVVEGRPIMSVNHCLPVDSSSVLLLAKTIKHPAARSLCDSWASCFIYMCGGLFTKENKDHYTNGVCTVRHNSL